MPTAVLDINLEDLPLTINNLHRYDKALCLFRFKSEPVGQKYLPVEKGYLNPQEFLQEIIDDVGYRIGQKWLEQFLEWEELKSNALTHKATIAICTRNRTSDLKRCLEALVKLPDDAQEIIVVDNSPSTNDTYNLVMTFPKIRYILEPLPGLDIARNRALKEAQNEVVAFIDDDAVPDQMWLRALVNNFNDPRVLCVTGLTMPLELETRAQEAFEKYSSFNKGFERKVYSSATSNPLLTGGIGAGANMALRKNVRNVVGLFDEALDAGTLTQSGGDHEFFARILISGFHIVYEPKALNWHKHRQTWKETRKAIEGYGTGVYAFWTRLLMEEREFGVLFFPLKWFIHDQLPNLLRSIFRRPNSQSLDLRLAELKGCYFGPWAYFISRRRVRKKRNAA